MLQVLVDKMYVSTLIVLILLGATNRDNTEQTVIIRPIFHNPIFH